MTDLDPDLDGEVIIDPGSYLTKCGFGGDDNPRQVFPTVIGNLKVSTCWGEGEKFFNDQAYASRNYLKVTRLLNYGTPTGEWGKFEAFLGNVLDSELRVSLDERRGVLLTESPIGMSKDQREKSTSFFFEKRNANAFYLGNQAVLSLIGSGRTTGLVIDSGFECFYCVPIYENHVIKHAIMRNYCGGQQITRYLYKLLSRERGIPSDYSEFVGYKTLDIVRIVKEKTCYISQDFESDLKESKTNPSKYEIEYELPDKRKVIIGSERFRASELLFNPQLIETGKGYSGIIGYLQTSLGRCDFDLRRKLYGNIVLTGGNMKYKGIKERIRDCVFRRCGSDLRRKEQVKVCHSQEDRERADLGSWCGASVLTQLSSFRKEWISRKEFEEHGVRIIHSKCF